LIREYNPKAFYSVEDVKFVNKSVETIYAQKRKIIFPKRK
jgi:hypothetical protein